MGGLEPRDKKGILIKTISARNFNCDINQSLQMRRGLVEAKSSQIRKMLLVWYQIKLLFFFCFF